MIQFNRQSLIKFVYMLIDVVCIILSMMIAFSMRSQTILFDVNLHNLMFSSANPFREILFFWIILSIFVNHVNSLYETPREIFESIEIWRVVNAVLTTSFIIIITTYLTKVQGFPRTILILSTGLICFTFSLWRIVKRKFVEYIVARGYNNFNVLIIGAGKVGQGLAKEIRKRPQLGLKVVGFLDDFKYDQDIPPSMHILGKLSDFKSLARREFVHEVFITLHHDSKVFLSILEEAKDLGIAVRVIPQGFNLMPSEFCKYNIGFIPVIEYSNRRNFRRQYGKRLFDFLVSSVALIVLLPVFLAIAILIKFDSRGPVFYLSRRFGRNGQIFKMIKFRSMSMDADEKIKELKEHNEVDGPIFKIRNDPRVTSIGRFLRKYSLDELPQFINVLKGDMSLVGPRPLPIEQIQRQDLRQLKRLEVRPGITGLWQIRGRSDISFSRLVKWDVWYISNWSFWLDITILLQTVPTVLKGKGAY